jgi:hypothetical protein
VQHAPDFSENNKGWALASILGFVFFNHDGNGYNMFPVTYIREVGFRQIDIDGNGIPDMEFILGLLFAPAMETDMTGLFEDFVLYFGGEDMKPGGEAWEVWEGIFVFYENGEDIF